MNGKSAVFEYQNVSSQSGVESSGAHHLIQLLLDGALQRIATAKGHVLRHETPNKGEQIGRAISIIEGLRVCLNPEAGELSTHLANLYEYSAARLLEANMKDDPDILDEVANLIREIKAAWDAVPERLEQERIESHQGS